MLGVGGSWGCFFFLSARGGLFAGKITFFLAANLAISVFKLWRSYILFLYLSLSFTFTSKTFLQFLSSCSLSLFLSILSCYLFRSLSLSSFPIQACFHFDLRLSTVMYYFALLPLFLAHKYTHTHANA